MSYKPQVLVHGSWSGNALAFATKEEAEASASDLAQRWLLVEDHRSVESDEPVNYSYNNHTLVPVQKDSAA